MALHTLKNLSVTNLTRHFVQVRNVSNSKYLMSKKVPEEAIPKNLIQEYYNSQDAPRGKIYDKRPFRMNLTAGKKYAWCNCGQSKSQPLCDGTHSITSLKIKVKPIFFKVAETKEYWLCNCKQSLHRPFCDGTHKNPEIQESVKHFKM